ncbi:microfibril-associated glycoprotein 4-like [Dreissena polymorpha]|uniref:Fibrinogen C-terminal domain-containing protein n=1 Tax=Dreissena polymorpha TaxID=45954 RepID=A0A9D4DC24_DREPO|nr:microfibril-associated glycoprotein 4-like [Dreissena polymorpha]KAH3741972.1 hypothetical protein DPMN_048702 [Dreissena polymorpha]
MFLYLSACALVLVGARAGGETPAGSVEFEQPTADVEPFSDVTVLNDADITKYRDCDEILASGSYKEAGAYRIYLNQSEPIVVYCQFELGSVSYVISIQKLGRVSFVQNFYNYEWGFGSIGGGDGWLGLRRIKALTDAGNNKLTVTMQDCNNVVTTLVWYHFSLGSPASRYTLYVNSYASGNVLPDDLSHNNGMPFSTIDRPDVNNCALHMRAGWWYTYCTYALPTGKLYPQCGPYTPLGGFYDGLFYSDWRGFGYSLKYFSMAISRD